MSESPIGSVLFDGVSARSGWSAGIVTILLAVALVFNLPAALQRALPDYTGSLQDKLADDKQVQQQLGGIVNDQNKELSNCANAV